MRLSPIDIRTPIVDTGGGIITQPWQQWVNELTALLSASWQGYSPAVSGSGGMLITALSVSLAEFSKSGFNATDIGLDISFTTSGTAGNTITVSLPVAPALAGLFACHIIDGGVLQLGIASINAGVIQVQKANLANFALSANQVIRITGRYRSL